MALDFFKGKKKERKLKFCFHYTAFGASAFLEVCLQMSDSLRQSNTAGSVLAHSRSRGGLRMSSFKRELASSAALAGEPRPRQSSGPRQLCLLVLATL